MKRLSICLNWLLAVALFSNWFVGAAVAADKEPAARKPAAVREKEDAATIEARIAERYKLPDGDSDELFKFIENLKRYRAQSMAEYAAHREKMVAVSRAAAEKILSTEKDKTSDAYKKASAMLFESRLRGIKKAAPAEQQKLFAELSDRLLSKEPDKDDFKLAESVAREFEFSENPELAGPLFGMLAAAYAKSDDSDLVAKAEGTEATARRLSLLGKPVELSGTTMDGKKFDLTSFRGKVVLIDFWATWCPPCVAEIPNVVKNYKAYHDKGFDVVGISLDQDREALEKFIEAEKTPWTTLHEKEGGGNHPMATYYGITGIPTVLLVDKDGKCISLNARGERLGELLKEQLGEPAPVKEEDSKADSTKDTGAKTESTKKKAAETK